MEIRLFRTHPIGQAAGLARPGRATHGCETPAAGSSTIDALGREYPDLSGHAIAAAVDAATTAARTVARPPRCPADASPEADQAVRNVVLTLARQRLDLTRERTAAATRRLSGGTHRLTAAHFH